MSVLSDLVEIMGLASGVAAGFLKGDAQTGANISAALILIIQKAMAAHEAQVGKPIDPALLKPYVPIP